jgi:putative aldouronate transport system substrate-binding protein
MNRPLLQYNLNRFAITTKDKYLPETVRWVDALYAPEMSAQLFFGSNGVGVQPSADGKWKILPPADQNVDPDTWKWMNSTGDFGPYFFSKDLQSRLIPTDFYKGRLDLDSVYKSYFPADRDIYPLVKFSKPDLDRLTILKTDIQKFVAQKYAEWVTKGVIDSQWDDYKSQLNKMGLEELLSIYQKNYDAFYK